MSKSPKVLETFFKVLSTRCKEIISVTPTHLS